MDLPNLPLLCAEGKKDISITCANFFLCSTTPLLFFFHRLNSLVHLYLLSHWFFSSHSWLSSLIFVLLHVKRPLFLFYLCSVPLSLCFVVTVTMMIEDDGWWGRRWRSYILMSERERESEGDKIKYDEYERWDISIFHYKNKF